MKASGAGAVMADKAPAVVEGDSPQVALWRAVEFFPTPLWAARAGGELIAGLDPGRWTCWEPACGQGHMAAGLADYFAGVYASDIHDHGWDGQHGQLDFLDPAADRCTPADWIVTNPPFGLAADFVRAGLRRARRGVAILARSTWFESAERYPLFFGEAPLAVYAPFFERVPMTLGRWDPKASTATAYAWFVWTKRDAAWAAEWGQVRPLTCEVRPIPPGTKARLTRPDDAPRFGWKGPAPLLEGMEGAP